MENMDIDDSLYSRQRYVLGDSAMQRMASSSVLLYGLGGVGVEIAKNVVLAGVKSITVQDPKCATVQDLGTQFFLREDDVSSTRNRAEASAIHLIELNPYVKVAAMTQELTEDSDLSYLKNFQCVILTECSIALQQRVNQFCRAESPQIKFISCDVFGVFGSAFCDFGDKFLVVDPTGEEPKDVFVEKVTKANPGVVTCHDESLHLLETGDVVTFREVKGMTELNGKQFKIEFINPHKFSIGDTSSFSDYTGGGIFTEVKLSSEVSFSPLEKQLTEPTLVIPDLTKFDAPPSLHLARLALDAFVSQQSRLPKPWDEIDAATFVGLAKDINGNMKNRLDDVDEQLLSLLAKCSSGSVAPLCAVFGGVVAQEALKALTGKFVPLNQWLYLDCKEIVRLEGINTADFQPRNDRYDQLRICVGNGCCQMLAHTNLFMVGCGAIGCEMMKNYALLGISHGTGKIVITDNDLIEKSNLNRQFLFRPRHIQKPKSTTAAQASLVMNKDLNIIAHQHKVCPDTETTVYTDAFFESQNIIVNALDNVEARRYMDSRCVTNQRPLMESGTMGTKGHVQVIVPHMTESYTSRQDPSEEDYPYCTVKSFPTQLEHCIQWARDKFEECFVQNAQLFNKFIEANPDLKVIATHLVKGQSIDGAVKVSKFLASRPKDWTECVQLARLRFEKYFNHKARQLLHAFPVDHMMEDGVLFWASPKRPPTPIEFNPEDEMHMLFVITTARLLADVYRLKWTAKDIESSAVESILAEFNVPEFRPSNKTIVTDESVSKDDAETTELTGDAIVQSGQRILDACQTKGPDAVRSVKPLDFEKDDDGNGHIDFITATTNLRAQMYSIDAGDRLKIKRIAGRIVPAIATTTAAVSGLVAIELIKVLQKAPLEQLKNCFLNLALPRILLTEPGAVERKQLREGLFVTMWDRWEVRGTPAFTMKQFLETCKEKFGFEGKSVIQGVKPVYLSFMPGHNKRLTLLMTELLKPSPDQKYVDLIVSFDEDDDEDLPPPPPVRYFFGN